MNDMILFRFESREIRTVADELGEPWFVAKDIAETLGYANTAQAVRIHCRKAKQIGVLQDSTPIDQALSLLINQ